MSSNDPSKLTFDQLLQLCEGKIPCKVKDGAGPFEGAVNGGNYIGKPGKDIYFFLTRLTPTQWDILIDHHSRQYPMVAPGNHLGNAAAIRYIYGQFEKQGILRSPEDRKRMENEKLDWEISRRFITDLQKKFKENKNHYGLSITCEMEAHRLGDEAVLSNSKDKLDEMVNMYMESVEHAHISKSYKQMFTPYYWTARYFMEFGDKKHALRYSKKTIEEAEKHCPDARGSYVEKLVHCAKYMKKHDKKGWKKWRDGFAKKAKNRCVKKLFGKV